MKLDWSLWSGVAGRPHTFWIHYRYFRRVRGRIDAALMAFPHLLGCRRRCAIRDAAFWEGYRAGQVDELDEIARRLNDPEAVRDRMREVVV